MVLRGFKGSTIGDRTVALAVKMARKGFGHCRSERP